MMTHKTYRAVAEIIDAARRRHGHPESRTVILDVVQGLEYVFGTDNPRFDRERFREACGVHD